MYVLINVGTEQAYQKANCYSAAKYKTEAAAKGVCTRLNKEYKAVQWKVMSLESYAARPIKMVERTNIMTGEKFMEAEDTPYFCSPSSESFWSM